MEIDFIELLSGVDVSNQTAGVRVFVPVGIEFNLDKFTGEFNLNNIKRI